MIPKSQHLKHPGQKNSGRKRRTSLNISMTSYESEAIQPNLHEIEEEDRPFVNNGMPKLKNFQDASTKDG